MATTKPVPVTLLSGFLGAGKTTLLEHMLRNKEGIRCAVIVNDMAEINIDASLVKGTRLLQTREKMVELHNGCICCTLREDLVVELRSLAASGEFDAVIIESTGVSEPMQVAESFFMDPPDGGPKLCTVARLDNCVTVVDCSTFADNLRTAANVAETYGPSGAPPCPPKPTPAALATSQPQPSAPEEEDENNQSEQPEEDDDMEQEEEEDDRNISHLLVDQVEFANLVLLNKTDLVTRERLEETVQLVKSLNPSAQVFPTTKSEVDLKWLLFTSKFTEAYALKAKGWMADIVNNIPHNPETLEYGIGSFVYRASLPFHPQRLYEVITKHFLLQEIDGADVTGADEDEAAAAASPTSGTGAAAVEEVDRRNLQDTLAQRSAARLAVFGNLLRSKGYVWIGSPARLGGFGEWNHAGNVLSFGYAGGWGMFPDPNGDVSSKVGHVATSFIEKTPGQEIVMIGQSLNKAAITAALNEALLTPAEEAQLAEAMAALQTQSINAAPGQHGAIARALAPFPDPFEAWAEEDDGDDDDDVEREAADATRRAASDAKWGGASTRVNNAGAAADDDEDEDEDEPRTAAKRNRSAAGGAMK